MILGEAPYKIQKVSVIISDGNLYYPIFLNE